MQIHVSLLLLQCLRPAQVFPSPVFVISMALRRFNAGGKKQKATTRRRSGVVGLFVFLGGCLSSRCFWSIERINGKLGWWFWPVFQRSHWKQEDFVSVVFLCHAGQPTNKPPRPPRVQSQELTDEQKQEIKEAFDLFDTDGSGAKRLLRQMSCWGLVKHGPYKREWHA